ncbi:unnamed protein product, partial [Pylaiella littoralis]
RVRPLQSLTATVYIRDDGFEGFSPIFRVFPSSIIVPSLIFSVDIRYLLTHVCFITLRKEPGRRVSVG